MRNIVDTNMGGSTPADKQILPVDNATVPYWRSELHDIDEHRSTENLPSECDIVIIGAGFAGVATAYHLSQMYAKQDMPSIVLLEARQVCSGATGRNGGHVKVKTATMQMLIKQLGIEAATSFHSHVMAHIPALKAVVEAEGIDCEFELRRSYDVFLDQEEADKAVKDFVHSLKNGEGWTKSVDLVGPQMVEQVTAIKGAKAAFSSPACSLWPYKFVSQILARLIERQAVNLQTSTPVANVEISADSYHSLVSTPRGTIRAKKVVFASNGYTAGILPVYKDTITPVKGTASHLVPSQPISPHLSHTYNIAYERPPHTTESRVDYLNPRPDGGIVVGGANWTYNQKRDRWYNNFDDSTIFPEAKGHFDTLMQRHFRGWERSGTGLESIWTGIMGYTSDSLPHVGEVPGREGRQWLLAGFNGGGNALIWLTAKGVAEMLGPRRLAYEQTALPAIFKTTRARLAGSECNMSRA